MLLESFLAWSFFLISRPQWATDYEAFSWFVLPVMRSLSSLRQVTQEDQAKEWKLFHPIARWVSGRMRAFSFFVPLASYNSTCLEFLQPPNPKAPTWTKWLEKRLHRACKEYTSVWGWTRPTNILDFRRHRYFCILQTVKPGVRFAWVYLRVKAMQHGQMEPVHWLSFSLNFIEASA